MKTYVKERIDIDCDTIDSVVKRVTAFAAKNGVPVKTVQFSIGCEEEYGDFYTRVFLCCDREENETEREIRLEREKDARKRQDAWDRKQLEDLKKKFPEQFK